MNNEKGYTLILVMIIITVTLILGLALSSAAINARVQLSKSDNRNKSTDLAEMGVTYYQTYVSKKIELAKTNAKYRRDHYNDGKKNKDQLSESELDNLYDPYFKEEITTLLSTNPSTVLVDTNENKFDLIFKNITQPDQNNLIVSFESIGKSGKETISVNGTFNINKSTNSSSVNVNDPKPTPSSYSIVENNPIYIVNQPKYKTNNDSTYFNNLVKIDGSRKLTVYGNAYFKNLTLQGTPATIIIYGDAIFENDISTNGNPSVCVTGKIFKLDISKTKLVDYPFPRNKCSNTSSIGDWQLDLKNGIKVRY